MTPRAPTSRTRESGAKARSGTRAMGTISLPRQDAIISASSGDVAATVLHVEDHEVEPAGGQHGPDAGAEELEHHLSEQYVSLFKPLSKLDHDLLSNEV